jgi:hypothetical protein
MRAALPAGCVGAALRSGWDDVIEHTRVELPAIVEEVQWCAWPRVEVKRGAPNVSRLWRWRGEHLSVSSAPEIPEHSACWQRHKASVVWDGVEWSCTQPGCMKRIPGRGPQQRDKGPLPYDLAKGVQADEWYAEAVKPWGDPARRRRCLNGRHEGKPWTRKLPIPEGPRPR